LILKLISACQGTSSRNAQVLTLYCALSRTHTDHLGFTDDLLHYLEIMRSRSPHMDIYLSGYVQCSSQGCILGRNHITFLTCTMTNIVSSPVLPYTRFRFSLGANVVLKALGEMGEHAACLYNIQGAAVACAPFKQESNYVLFNRPGINQIAYRRGLLKKMKDKARRQLERHCQGDENTSAFDYRRAVDAETIQEFEDAFLAPIYGFDSFMDYYQKTSCIHFLESIAVPTLILNAADGTFLQFSSGSYCVNLLEYIRYPSRERTPCSLQQPHAIDPFFDPTVNPSEKSIEHGGAGPIKLVYVLLSGFGVDWFDRRRNSLTL
jgi:hypothetical protein